MAILSINALFVSRLTFSGKWFIFQRTFSRKLFHFPVFDYNLENEFDNFFWCLVYDFFKIFIIQFKTCVLCKPTNVIIINKKPRMNWFSY